MAISGLSTTAPSVKFLTHVLYIEIVVFEGYCKHAQYHLPSTQQVFPWSDKHGTFTHRSGSKNTKLCSLCNQLSTQTGPHQLPHWCHLPQQHRTGLWQTVLFCHHHRECDFPFWSLQKRKVQTDSSVPPSLY